MSDEKPESSVAENKSLRDRIAAAIMRTCHGVYMDDAAAAADAVIADVTAAASSAIRSYAQSEMASLSYHDPCWRETAYEAMQKLDGEANRIVLYAMTYRGEEVSKDETA